MKKKKIIWCKLCVLPNTRPNLKFQNGICNACGYRKIRKKIDWNNRKKLFLKLIKKFKSKNNYDCLIPVSGGKDSTWQVLECKKLGLRPLTLTWRAPQRTSVGQKNLNNLINLGVDHIDFSIDPSVESYFTLKSFKKYGATAIPMHLAIFNLPQKIAKLFKIPLIIYGENSASEDGFDDKKDLGFNLDEKWIKKYGVTHNTRAEDWYDKKLNSKNMTAYKSPDKKGFKPKSLFLGEFFKWDTEKSLKIAKKSGFINLKKPKTGYYNYADIDDALISIHHFLKIYKFGFSRLNDNLSIEIRNKRISRDKAIKILQLQKNNLIPKKIFKSFVNLQK